MDRSPDRLIELSASLEKPRENYLLAKQVVDRYDRGKNAKLGMVLQDIPRLSQNGKPISLQERIYLAYSSEAWREYLAQWGKAEKVMIEARVLFENLETQLSSYQSALAFDRETVRKGIS